MPINAFEVVLCSFCSSKLPGPKGTKSETLRIRRKLMGHLVPSHTTIGSLSTVSLFGVSYVHVSCTWGTYHFKGLLCEITD